MIPAEAIEAALAAELAYPNQRGMDNAEKRMRATLEAAAPIIRAEAWDEGYDAGVLEERPGWTKNPHRTAK